MKFCQLIRKTEGLRRVFFSVSGVDRKGEVRCDEACVLRFGTSAAGRPLHEAVSLKGPSRARLRQSLATRNPQQIQHKRQNSAHKKCEATS